MASAQEVNASDDIVDRLRISSTSMTDKQNAERLEAAGEIWRLRVGNDEYFNTIQELREKCERLRIDIARVVSERDEARQEVSYLRPSVCLGAQTANEYARERGWDCFKEPVHAP